MKKLIINSQNQIRIVPHSDIIVIKSDNCYTSVYLISDEKLTMCKSLSLLSKELDSIYFIRVNQSYLVNRDFIKSIDKKNKFLELLNLKRVPFTITLKELLSLIKQDIEIVSILLIIFCKIQFFL